MKQQNGEIERPDQEPTIKSKFEITRRSFISRTLAATGLIILATADLSSAGLLQSAIAKGRKIKTKFKTLQRLIKGRIVTPQDPVFKQVKHGLLWNELQPKRSPDVIVQVDSTDDVIEAVKYARKNNLKVSIRGGGHLWCGTALRKGGLLIDLGRLNKVISIDQTTRTAITQPVVSNREMIDALAPKGFAFPVGHCPGVKVSGYLLNGGLGWNQGSWGPATLSVESIKIVTSQGKLINASSQENKDYFWAARGAGPGFFGVATEYKLKLFDMPKAIYSSAYFYPLERVGEVADWLTDLANKLPTFVELSMFLVQAPEDIAAQCVSSNGKVVLVTAAAYTDTKEQAMTTLNTLRGCPVSDDCLSKSEKEKTDFQKLMDASGKIWPPHLRNKVNAMWSNKSAKELFTAVAEHFKNAPSNKSCFVYVFNLKRDCPPLKDVAFSMVANLYGGLWTMWDQEKDDDANLKWHAQAYNILQPLTFGHYIGESDIVDYPENAEQSYSAASWKRLAELREKYDPDGIFWGYKGGLRSVGADL